jgi:protein SCO1/2
LCYCGVASGVFLISDNLANKWESERILEVNLTDSKGRPWQFSQLKDKIGIVYFGYTSCPDVCPTALNDLIIALDGLGPDRFIFKPVFVSVDPARDSGLMIHEYTSYFSDDILGLTGSESELKVLTFNFGATYSYDKKNPLDKDYLVNHTAGFFMVNSKGHRLPMSLSKNPDELGDKILTNALDNILSKYDS